MANRLYSASFDNVAVTAVQDLFCIVTPATTGCTIHKVIVGQTNRFGDTMAEGLRWAIFRAASTTPGSGGTAVTAAAGLSPGVGVWSSSVRVNDTTIATGGSPQRMHADVWNVQAGLQFFWTPETMIEAAPSSRLVVTLLEAPIASMTMSGTIYWEED